jgi:hypothetical protein
MSNKTSGVNWDKRSQARQRRQRVIERLESQLNLSTKTVINLPVPLSDSDIKRIKKEIETLKTRI